MINGEAACTGEWATKGQWISYAQENRALCFLVEHRFYGGSRPLKWVYCSSLPFLISFGSNHFYSSFSTCSDTSTQSLKFLSSEQALADLAYFIEGMKGKLALPENTKWIVFGGSYAGSLAAWLRIKYPHLVHGAVSSSGPLLAKIDFFGEYSASTVSSLSLSFWSLLLCQCFQNIFKWCNVRWRRINQNVPARCSGPTNNWALSSLLNRVDRKSENYSSESMNQKYHLRMSSSIIYLYFLSLQFMRTVGGQPGWRSKPFREFVG